MEWFKDFLDKFHKKLMKKYSSKRKNGNFKKPLIIIDNCSCHKTNMIKSWLMRHKLEFLFNLPYYSPANPIEYFFSELKIRCRGVKTDNH